MGPKIRRLPDKLANDTTTQQDGLEDVHEILFFPRQWLNRFSCLLGVTLQRPFLFEALDSGEWCWTAHWSCDRPLHEFQSSSFSLGLTV